MSTEIRYNLHSAKPDKSWTVILILNNEIFVHELLPSKHLSKCQVCLFVPAVQGTTVHVICICDITMQFPAVYVNASELFAAECMANVIQPRHNLIPLVLS